MNQILSHVTLKIIVQEATCCNVSQVKIKFSRSMLKHD